MVATVKKKKGHSFLLLSCILWNGCTSVYSPIEGYLGCFWFSVSTNKGAINICVWVFVCI